MMTLAVMRVVTPAGLPTDVALLPADAAKRLYLASRDLYAPVLAAFAACCLRDLCVRREGLNLCLARDGIGPFLAQRVLLRSAPARLPHVRPHQVRLVYLSRQLVRDGRSCPEAHTLVTHYLEDFLRVPDTRRAVRVVTLVDVGIFGSIQDELQRWYPDRELHGRYLIYRRRTDDVNAPRKRGFLAGDPAAPNEAGFLRRAVVHLLEDLWSGVYESVTSLRQTRMQHPFPAVRPVLERLGARTQARLHPNEVRRLKRAALRGVVDGVARTVAQSADSLFDDGRDRRDWTAAKAQQLAQWIASTREVGSPDGWLWRTLIRPDRETSGTYE